MSWRLTTFAIERFSVVTISRGVPAGASRPTHVPPTTLTPDSTSVGMSGAIAARLSDAIAIALILPARA